MNHMKRQIDVVVNRGDALTAEGDVLALKFAHRLFGVDAAVVDEMQSSGIDVIDHLPSLSESFIIDSRGVVAAKSVLFVGVGNLYDFEYQQIREFSRLVLSSLVDERPRMQTLLVTLHGVGYGLDEVEAFESEIAGFIDAITDRDYPESLRKITFVERNPDRAERLRVILRQLLPDGVIPIPGFSNSEALGPTASNRLRSVGYDSASKKNIFVAMSFAEEMDDVYHYGILGVIKEAGFLCERADLSSFTGDVMTWVKHRIDTASLVIAELSGANPNVYLEVGYAWGRKIPTVLLVRDTTDLKFDVEGQRCLHYKRIQDLEELLHKELRQLGLNNRMNTEA